MDKYIIRATVVAIGAILGITLLVTEYGTDTFLDRLINLIFIILIAISITEFIICLICYHHALWNQNQTEQKSQDGTK